MKNYTLISNTLLLKLLVVSILLFSCKPANTQTIDDLLDSKLDTFNEDIIRQLNDSGVVSEFEIQLIGNYIIRSLYRGIDLDQMTIKQALDSVRVLKIRAVVQHPNFIQDGNDSVFIRMPEGDKILLGMGKLSLEKLVFKYAQKLPKKYADDKLNIYFSDVQQITQIMSKMELDGITATLLGATMHILKENKEEISSYRIGDILEIIYRIKNAKEFEPFLNALND